MNILLPSIWIIVFIVGLPQLSETVYTPSLPDIARSLHTSDSMVEFTLTLYLFGFAIGTLFWGKLSDHVGRKPCVLAGILIFILGSVGCYFSSTITALLLSRVIQAFGGSIGSVLGQAISRDAFHGPALGRVYSSVGSSLALFPAIGPIIGGYIAEQFGWSGIFIFLILFAIVLLFFVYFKLPETHHAEQRDPVALSKVFKSLIKDPKVLGFAWIVGSCNGISFSYFAEGSFYLIELLGLSPSHYGLSFLAIAASTLSGGILSKKLHQYYSSEIIMGIGIKITTISTLLFLITTLVHSSFFQIPNSGMIVVTIISQMATMFGICMITSNALALSLTEYKWCIGAASSLFGFFYYGLISLFTFGMGLMHNGTLIPMPMYFFGIMMLMGLVKRRLLMGE
jgi:Bcr/CflA subfamily drug resistance transporter